MLSSRHFCSSVPDRGFTPWAASHEPRGGASYPRIAEVNDGASGDSGLLLFVRRISRMAGEPGWVKSLREVPGTGIRQGSQGPTDRRRVSEVGGRSKGNSA